MKIKHKDLQKLYRSYIVENTPLSRKNCPSIKEITFFFKPKTSEKKKTKIIDHVTNCYYCAQEFEFILHTLRCEKELNEEIGNLLHIKDNRNAKNRKAKENATNLKKVQKLFFPKFYWKYAWFLIGATIVISALIIIHNSEKREYRGINLNRVHLIKPINGTHSKSLLEFKWTEIKDSDYYILELFDETLFPIWKSNKIIKNQVILPNKIAKSLTENKTYFWMVTAFLLSGRKIESDIEAFKVKD